MVLLTLGLIKIWIHVLGLGIWSPIGQRVPGMGEVVGDRGMKDRQDSCGLGIIWGGNNPGELSAPPP